MDGAGLQSGPRQARQGDLRAGDTPDGQGRGGLHGRQPDRRFPHLPIQEDPPP